MRQINSYENYDRAVRYQPVSCNVLPAARRVPRTVRGSRRPGARFAGAFFEGARGQERRFGDQQQDQYQRDERG